MTTRKPAKAGYSPQLLSARARSAMTKAPLSQDVNFLMNCSEVSLESYELTKLSLAANIQADLLELLHQWVEANTQATIARLFRVTNREALKQWINEPVDPMAIAKAQIRTQGYTEEEADAKLDDILAANPGLARRTKTENYQKRNIAEGKCAVCPKPLDRNSVRFCEKHLRAARLRHKPIGSAAPGSIEFLYADADALQSRHGRQPGTLASLAMAREQKTRANLAELGIPPESAAISLKAAKEALVKCMPEMKGIAKTLPELMAVGQIPVEATARRALHELLADGTVERTGEGKRGDPFRYFAPSTETRKPTAGQTKAKNKLLLQTLRGQEPTEE
jgi:hypothetical protein